MARWPRAAALLLTALLHRAAGRQPATAEGAVAASEKLAPKTTPVGMVVNLLKELTVKVEAEGKAEAAAYDKYACFCKEQADGKLYNIEKSTKKIEELDAKIKELKADLAELATKISELSAKVDAATKAIEKLDADRAAEFEQYETDSAELVAAISACKRAAEALASVKTAMEGKAQTEAALVQVSTAAAAVSRRGVVVLSADQQAALNELARGGVEQLARRSAGPTDGTAYASSYHSNEIIQLIDDLYEEFTAEKNSLDSAEFESKKLYDNLRLAQTKEKEFSEADKETMEKIAAKKEAEKATAKEDRYVEDRAKKQDNEFLDVLTGQCQEKAELFDQRSKQRAGELSALGQATEALESGVVPNEGANKKLVDLQTPSFLQLRGRGRSEQEQRRKVTSLLTTASDRLSSSVLAMASLRVQASDDHFVKVRQLMKDIIARLEEEASTEADKKSMCDKSMKEAITQRDEATAAYEGQNKDKAIQSATSSELAMDIAELSKQIAANKKELMEASELRAAESSENGATLEDAKTGLEMVTQAITILQNFYDQASTALLQKRGRGAHAKRQGPREDELRFRSTNADREGNTVNDLAPDVFGGTYKGQQEASTGIIGTLEVIQSDFQRTIAATEEAESKAEGEFTTFKTESEKDTDSKSADKEAKETGKTVADEAVLSLETQLGDSEKSKDAAENTLEKLRDACVEKEETYEERVAKRNQEIEALKEAHAILEDWQEGF